MNERFPPSTPDAPSASRELATSEPTHEHRKPCPRDGYLSPLVDTANALLGVTWIVWANERAQPKEYVPASQNGTQFTPEQRSDPGDNQTVTNAARLWGYGSLVGFTASAIYGVIVEGACSSYRHRLERQAKGVEPPESARHGFPVSVLQFGFGMTLAEAGNACESSGRVFQVDGARASCPSAPGKNGASDVWLRYGLGRVSEITVVYGAAPGKLDEQFRSLFASLRGFYGEPQVPAPTLSGECRTSLERCLASEEQPGGPVWHWPSGSIEMAPVWRDDQARIELRYIREE